MHDIICPHCGKAFKIDEAGYADILKQVRDRPSSSSCTSGWNWPSRTSAMPSSWPRTRLAGELQQAAAAKDAEIQGLKASLDAGEVARKLAVAEALSAVEKSATRWPTSSSRPSTTSSPRPGWPRRCWSTNCRRPLRRRTPRSRA
jgi:hypothetical protein